MKESELTEAGWYWFEPETIKIGRWPGFVEFDEAPDVKYLDCPNSRGQYYGPIDIEALKSQLGGVGGLFTVTKLILE